MANAKVMAGASRLKSAIRSLRDEWILTEPTWNDVVRQRFEQRYLTPLEPAADSALVGMQKLADVLDRIRRDCTDRSELP